MARSRWTGRTCRLAPPPLQSNFYGTVRVDGADVPVGTLISAWIDGVKYAEAQTSFFGGDSVYSINVRGDDPLTPEKEGGVEDDTIVFHIGGLTADQTGIWHGWSNVQLDLTAGTPVERGSITIVKAADPAGGTGFDFSGDLGSFSLDDGDSELFDNLDPGNYNVTEDAPAGWHLDDVVCTGGDSTPIADGVQVHLDPDGDIVCIFTNVAQPGSISIVKETDPDGGTGFSFTVTGGLGTFSLDDDESNEFNGLDAGDYDVTEVVPAGWDLDDVVCTGGDSDPISNGVEIHLDLGGAIICTFTNVQISPGPTDRFIYLPLVQNNSVVALDLAMEHSKGHKR